MGFASKIKVGQQVVVKIDRGGEYTGTICRINKERTRLQLEDVHFRQTQFYLPEIQSIDVIADVPVPIDATETDKNEDEIKFHSDIQIQRFVTTRIESDGEAFDKAIEEICQQEFVGVHAKIVNGVIQLIMCGTQRNIYGFDMKKIGAVDERFKKWFESNDHTKVIHNAAVLAANLLHCHGIVLKRVFDTSVVNRLLKRTTLPPELAEETNCNEVGKTAILLKFQEFLTEQLLRNAYRSFDTNMDFYRNKDNVEMQRFHRNEKSIVQRLGEIPPFKLNLPNDLDK